MQLHVGGRVARWKAAKKLFRWQPACHLLPSVSAGRDDRRSGEPIGHPDFLDIARLQAPNPLLYRLFPLTCARSQE
jgi:hypothetical protein